MLINHIASTVALVCWAKGGLIYLVKYLWVTSNLLITQIVINTYHNNLIDAINQRTTAMYYYQLLITLDVHTKQAESIIVGGV